MIDKHPESVDLGADPIRLREDGALELPNVWGEVTFANTWPNSVNVDIRYEAWSHWRMVGTSSGPRFYVKGVEQNARWRPVKRAEVSEDVRLKFKHLLLYTTERLAALEAGL